MSTDGKNKKSLVALLRQHAAALGYVLGVVLPVILRTGRRPVIFSRFIGMGDIICTIPATQALRQRHPGVFSIYNCHPDFAGIPKIAGVADWVTSLEAIGFVGHHYRFLLGGFYHFAHRGDLPGQNEQEPMVVEFCRQFNLPVTTEHAQLPVTEFGKKKALAVLAEKKIALDSLILIHPGPSWPVREWPRENWERLLAELKSRGFNNIGQLGVGRYLTVGKVEVAPVPGAVSLLDAFAVEECVAAIAQAKLFIGIDSGLLHIAASTRTPAVGIFGMTLPEYRFSEGFRQNFAVSRIECAGCEHRRPRLHWFTNCPYEIKCMRSIDVSEVLQACLNVLERSPKN